MTIKSDKQSIADYRKQAKIEKAQRTKAMANLLPEQTRALREVNSTLKTVLSSLQECQDIWLSDVGKLEGTFWRLQNSFNLDNS